MVSEPVSIVSLRIDFPIQYMFYVGPRGFGTKGFGTGLDNNKHH